MKIHCNEHIPTIILDNLITHTLETLNINNIYNYQETTKNGLETWTIIDQLTRTTLLVIVQYENSIIQIDQIHPHPTIKYLSHNLNYTIQYHRAHNTPPPTPINYTAWSMSSGKNNPLYNRALQELSKEQENNPIPSMNPLYPTEKFIKETNWIK